MPRTLPTKQQNPPAPTIGAGTPGKPGAADAPFWKTTPLAEMNAIEWESLCDGCGRCCLLKLEDEDTGDIAVTRLACKLLDIGTCRCSGYADRQDHVPDCVKLEPQDIGALPWLPATCAYRAVAEGRDLAWWHPLVSGTADSIFEAGISVRDFARSEASVLPQRFAAHIAYWIEKRRPSKSGPS